MIPATITHDGTEYAVTEIADEAFRENLDISYLTLPNSIVTIGKKAFYNAFEGLYGDDLVIPDSVTSIGEGAFGGVACETLVIGEGLTSIPSGAFANMWAPVFGDAANVAVTIGSNVTEIAGDAFDSAEIGSLVIKGETAGWTACSSLWTG